MKTKLTCLDCCFFGEGHCWADPVAVTRFRWSPACTLRVDDETYCVEHEPEVSPDVEPEPCPRCGAWMANVLDGLEAVRMCSDICTRSRSTLTKYRTRA